MKVLACKVRTGRRKAEVRATYLLAIVAVEEPDLTPNMGADTQRGEVRPISLPATCCAPEAVFAVMEPPPNAELERLLNGGHSALGRGFEGFGA